jgi:hypothetical protein
MARYEVQDSATGEVLSRHRTRQGAVDRWRQWYVGIPVRIYRTYVDGNRVLVVEGTWHRTDDAHD